MRLRHKYLCFTIISVTHYFLILPTFKLGKQAAMSSVYRSSTGPSKATDGIYVPEDGVQSLADSDWEENPWWRVDLGGVHCIWAIEVLNRGNVTQLKGRHFN